MSLWYLTSVLVRIRHSIQEIVCENKILVKNLPLWLKIRSMSLMILLINSSFCSSDSVQKKMVKSASVTSKVPLWLFLKKKSQRNPSCFLYIIMLNKEMQITNWIQCKFNSIYTLTTTGSYHSKCRKMTKMNGCTSNYPCINPSNILETDCPIPLKPRNDNFVYTK